MTPHEMAARRIDLAYEAIDALRAKIEQWQDEGVLDDGYAKLKLRELTSRETDLGIERDLLRDTGQVTNPPTQQQIDELADAVENLRNFNAASSAAKGIITQVFTLIRIARG